MGICLHHGSAFRILRSFILKVLFQNRAGLKLAFHLFLPLCERQEKTHASRGCCYGLIQPVGRLKEKKPVVAYLGEVAASGGYYIASHADAIVAQPLTLTGFAIGVVSVRVLAEGLLDRMGVRTEVLRTGPHADMDSLHRPLTDDERKLINRELDAFYDTLVAIVANGRGMTIEDVERLARGRVWWGVNACQHGFVDELGGFDKALANLKKRTGPFIANADQACPARRRQTTSRGTSPSTCHEYAYE